MGSDTAVWIEVNKRANVGPLSPPFWGIRQSHSVIGRIQSANRCTTGNYVPRLSGFLASKRSLQPGQIISSKFTRLISCGSMTLPHLGQVVLRLARTFCRSIFLRDGMSYGCLEGFEQASSLDYSRSLEPKKKR